jgi:hypothetical protein
MDEGAKATADVGEFADLARSTWSVVEAEESSMQTAGKRQ